jgi:hypothetical protein
MGASPFWKATDINGTCSGDIALMRGNPLLSSCNPDLAISEFAPTHTWSVGNKYGVRECVSYVPHAATNEYYCEMSRDMTNNELVLDVHSAGTMEVANSGTLFKNIEFIFTTTNSNLSGWALNPTDLVTRVYRKSSTEMFADVVTGDLVNAWTTSESELFPDFVEKNYNYAAHTVATPKSTFVEDTAFGTHFRIVYDLNDSDLALLTGDFKVQGIPFSGTDGVWLVSHTWDLSGNQYFGSSISSTGDMATQASYITIDAKYFAIQDALHYFFTNVNRDSNHSMCSILNDNARLNEVTTWYQGLSSEIVDKLAITPDHNVTVKETLDYVLFQANANNPHASALYFLVSDKNNLTALFVVMSLTMAGIVVSAILIKKKIGAKN